MRRATVQILELPPHAFPSLACPCESCVSLSIITEPHHSLPTRSWHVEAVLVPWPLPHRRSQQANLSSKWVFLLSPDTDKLHLPFDSWLIYWFVTRSGEAALMFMCRCYVFAACGFQGLFWNTAMRRDVWGGLSWIRTRPSWCLACDKLDDQFTFRLCE